MAQPPVWITLGLVFGGVMFVAGLFGVRAWRGRQERKRNYMDEETLQRIRRMGR